jgi:hypothetical protein
VGDLTLFGDVQSLGRHGRALVAAIHAFLSAAKTWAGHDAVKVPQQERNML